MGPQQRDRQAICEELARVLSSSAFVRNERLSRFLRFLVERHLDGRDEEIKESLIAVEVFGRRPDYDPKLDSIVRTEAGRLRARLTEYYAAEGSQDPGVIDVPKGGYVPRFREAAARSEPRITGSRRRMWLAVACATLAVGVAAMSWWRLAHSREPIRIAVLPLENLSQDSGHDYFADGLTDQLIRDLSIIEGLEVRSQTSSFAFQGKSQNVRQAGRQLEVDYILEGSVLRADHRLRINAQLVRVRDDHPLWSGAFERELIDVFAIQDEISRSIVNHLRLQLGRGRRRYETSVEAYDFYLQGRALPLRHGTFGVLQSIGPFEQAVTRDPSFAPAYAGLGAAYAIRSIQFPVDHPADELEKMRAAAKKAVELDPLLAEAHAAVALAQARDSQWGEAEKSFRRAIELDPNRSSTYTDFAQWLLHVVGRNDEALGQLRIAQKTDPLAPDVHLALATTLMSIGRYEQAGAECQKMLVEDSLRNQCLARTRLEEGRIDEAIPLLMNDPNPQSLGFLGYAYAHSGRRADAEKLLDHSPPANQQALIFAGLGDEDRALEALDRMAALGAQRVGMYLNSPEFSSLRGDPRLGAFRKRVGLPD
jgi:TolB-like protein/Flp pilus assembly protein TadD